MSLTNSLITELLQAALLAVQAAGQYILESIDKVLEINYKGRANIVTQVDRGSEDIIISVIKEKFRDHSIMAEERPAINTTSDYKWIIDPLDGTTNYIHGFPIFSTSIALASRNEVILGVVYDPIKYVSHSITSFTVFNLQFTSKTSFTFTPWGEPIFNGIHLAPHRLHPIYGNIIWKSLDQPVI